LLDSELRMKARPGLRFAGQITGVEGYIESAAIGMLAGIMAACERTGETWQAPPVDTAHGALLAHITGGAMADSFQPMNVNFGLFPEVPPPEGKRKLRGRDRKMAYASRALDSFKVWATGRVA
jgi:methylenetetrahydrofolate--tRNA-(uracil-5-)-methyltransferase